MREFASKTAAGNLPAPAKVLYTAFATFTMVGLLSSVMIYHDIVRFTARSTPSQLNERLVGHYHAGTATQLQKPAHVSYRELLDITHFHLFSMSVLLLVSGHMFLLTSFSSQAKAGWVGAGVAATALHIAAPWLVYLGGLPAGWIYPVTGAFFLATLTVLTCTPVWEMWRPR